jgi:phosphoribosylglycinamide formyltransferase-1
MVSGGGSNMQAVMDGIATGEIPGQIVRVISSAAKAYALERARANGIEAIALPKRYFDSDAACDEARHRAIDEAKPDLILLAGYLGIVPRQTVEKYRGRIINIHPALIPSFCGKGMYGHHVHEAVLAYGAKVSGATVHFVEEGVDTGPIILQDTVPVLQGDDADTLAARVLQVEHRIFPLAAKLFLEDKLRVQGRRVWIEE